MKFISAKKTLFSYIGLFIVAMIWGLAFTVVKASLDVVPPVYMIAFRFSIAAIAMSIVFWKKFKTMTRRTILYGLIPGLFLYLAYVIQTIGCKYTTAGKNAFLTALYIIVVPFLHWGISKKRPGFKLFVAAVIAMAGIGFISLNGDWSINIGDVLTIICGVLFAMQIAALDTFVEAEDPVSITVIEMIECAVLGWVAAPFLDGGFPTQAMTVSVWGSMLFLGLISTLVCQLLQSVCQKYTKPENASLIMSLESLFGALGSVIFLHERMSAKMILGCALMMAAIVLANVGGEKKEE